MKTARGLSPDLVLANARVLTLDPRRPQADLVAIKGDRIVHVGDRHELTFLKGPGTRIIDCQGMALLPGFKDAHLHFLALASSLLDGDPTAVETETLKEIRVRMTVVEGKVVWEG